jgi:hypothetical protein
MACELRIIETGDYLLAHCGTVRDVQSPIVTEESYLIKLPFRWLPGGGSVGIYFSLLLRDYFVTGLQHYNSLYKAFLHVTGTGFAR